MMSFSNFLRSSRKLGRVGRWANEYMTDDVRPTVASHSFTTSQVAQLLGLIEEKNGNKIDWKSLYEKALNHDCAEALTGDILSHVKNDNEEIKNMIIEIEKKLVNEIIIDKLPDDYKDEYSRILFNGKDQTLEGKILKAADTIDMIIECVLEIERGNPEKIFVDSYRTGVIKLQSMNDVCSINYFLENILPDFEIKVK